MGHPMFDFIEATLCGLREHRCWRGWWGALRAAMADGVIGWVDSSGDVDALSPSAKDLPPPARDLPPSAKTCHDLPRAVSFDRSVSRGTSRWACGAESGTVVDLCGGVQVRADHAAGEVSSAIRRSSRERGRPPWTACHRLPHLQNQSLTWDDVSLRALSGRAQDLKKWVTHPFAGECLFV